MRILIGIIVGAAVTTWASGSAIPTQFQSLSEWATQSWQQWMEPLTGETSATPASVESLIEATNEIHAAISASMANTATEQVTSTQEAATTKPDALAEPEVPVDNTVAFSTAPVWSPFRNHLSAEGFAHRLNANIAEYFRVERKGTGRYQVVFDYANEQDKALILASVDRVVGILPQ